MSGGIPCCVHVAYRLLDHTGMRDDKRYRPGGAWWRRANVWDPRVPGSAMGAWVDLLITHGPEPVVLYGKSPRLHQIDSWWAVQGWRGKKGHQFLLRAGVSGDGTLDHSSTKHGRRVTHWASRCEVDGYLSRYDTLGLVQIPGFKVKT